MTGRRRRALALSAIVAAAGCSAAEDAGPPTVSGFVEATEVHVASRTPGRVTEVLVEEGERVDEGAVVVRLATEAIDLGIRRAEAERDQALAQLRLLQAGARPDEVRQAEAQRAAARAERDAATADLAAARADEARFAQLVEKRAGTEKARDDAAARRALAESRLQAAEQRAVAADAVLAGLRAGARPEEIAAARARVEAARAQVALLEDDRDEATITAPLAGVVASRLVEPGELLSPGQPAIVIIDLDRAWANVFVAEPLIPTLRLGDDVVVTTDAGDRLPGRLSFISPRAEFTPRNVQTAEERAKLVYEVKVAVDNREGILKPGMPVEVELTGSGAR